MSATGAVVVGRRTAEQAGHYKGDHRGVPIFVLSRRPPPPSAADHPLVTYVSDGIVSAMAQAKAAAGGRDVLVHGANMVPQALEAGVLDEIRIDQIPVLLGAGRRLFGLLPDGGPAGPCTGRQGELGRDGCHLWAPELSPGHRTRSSRTKPAVAATAWDGWSSK